MNVTGAAALSGTLSASGVGVGGITPVSNDFYAAIGSGLVNSAAAPGVVLGGTAAPTQIRGPFSDGASAVAVRIAASVDLTNATSKIASFGDNAGTSYAEKSYLDLNGYWRAPVFGNTGTLASWVAPGATNLVLAANGSNIATVTANGFEVVSGKGFAVGGVTAIKTTDYVATVADFLIPVDVNTTGNVQVTLPAANAAKGQMLTIKASATHATRIITIIRAGSDTIEGRTAADTSMTLSPTATLDHVSLVSDGTSKWYLTDFSGTIT
jgi:hypothetical protein